MQTNRSFAGSSHMVGNKLHWDANNTVGLPKQRNSYQFSPTFLCFESPTALFASQCNLFRTMWPDPAKGLLAENIENSGKLGKLNKPRRRQPGGRRQTKGLMSKKIAVHVRYKSWYITLPSFAKQQSEMTKFCVAWVIRTMTATFSYFHLKLIAVIAYLLWARF